MTTRPELRVGSFLLPGVLAIALFGMMTAIVLNTTFTGTMQGFPDGISVTSEIGYALFDLEPLQSTEGSMGNTEPFLVSFFLVAIVLDAALDAALVLAKREDEGEPVAALSSQSTGVNAGRRGNIASVTDDDAEFRSGSGPMDDGSVQTDGGEDA
ncbi:hypothetical protein [Halostagnicola sp. A-GB9-2]|uniref:hypothetical protein n=1 Tax=Halostagnicola sp. A-GB9-2 TaxID=3048066 RepID=UPI0024C0ADBE|nr:hypothetical protein [Halostagnicola sp. A-GB9-2]MDJ1430757.1 hypothetical protein [Halostagnicola sp. A-GB9-2]